MIISQLWCQNKSFLDEFTKYLILGFLLRGSDFIFPFPKFHHFYWSLQGTFGFYWSSLCIFVFCLIISCYYLVYCFHFFYFREFYCFSDLGHLFSDFFSFLYKQWRINFPMIFYFCITCFHIYYFHHQICFLISAMNYLEVSFFICKWMTVLIIKIFYLNWVVGKGMRDVPESYMFF